jgi:hydroxymethylpyrimidine/phosphomethylpyrimidine kinase
MGHTTAKVAGATMTPVILSIAGYDPSSGAGVTADVKTASAHGCYAVTCVTALTVQNTVGVQGLEPVRAEVVSRTLAGLAEDFEISAVRIGMLSSGEVAGAVADFLKSVKLSNVVLDPVVKSSSGAELIDAAGLRILRERLVGLSDVVTPNIAEAIALTKFTEPKAAATKLIEMGAKAVVITGGETADSVDLLYDGVEFDEFRAPKIASRATHGTGCAFATSMACGLAKGRSVREALIEAKVYVRKAIENAPGLGRGVGPMKLG